VVRGLTADARDVAPVDDRQEEGMPMKAPPHPGLSVRHDCIEPLGLTVTEAADVLGISHKQLSDIVNGRAGISPEMAIRLDKAFGGGAETWLRLQAAYDLARAMKHASRIRVKRLTPAA
jgi:addiction module HigA family antidote